MRALVLGILLALSCLLADPKLAAAHGSSNSYLTLRADGARIDAEWSIALRDLDYVVGLDANGDGAITWGEVRARAAAIDAYALSRLAVHGDGAACVPGMVRHLADTLGGSGYVVLRLAFACPAVPEAMTVRYTAFFDADPQHRGLVRTTFDGVTRADALSPQTPDLRVARDRGIGTTAAEFFGTGLAHLLTGPDHMLFLAMLLVPAMLRRNGGGRGGSDGGSWSAVPRFAPAFVESVKVLSAFTIAHALTLSSAVLGYLHLPAQTIDAAIAATILVTAIDNIRPFLPGRRWMLAFLFGLIHGFGFANALGPLQLPPATLALALLAFNVGIEAAQVLLAAVVLPVGFWARNTRMYQARVLPGASGVAAVLALGWLADRAAGLGVMPF